MDLSVLPCLSNRHIQKFRECGSRRVLPKDEIWQTAKNRWKELPNSNVDCRQKFSTQKATTNFLAQVGSIHCGIGNDFKFTENGI
jgi:hypothetical protein